MSRSMVLMLVVGASVLSAAAQSPGIGTWQTVATMTAARGVAVAADGSLLAATGGGVYRYDLATDTYRRWTNADGLPSNDLTAIAVTRAGAVWVGASDGSLAWKDAAGDQWHSITDIALSNRLQRSIQRLIPRGDTLFVVAQFGVVVFRTDRMEFADAYANLGFSSTPTAADVAVAADSIWIATDQGLAVAARSAINLSSPTSWRRFGTSDGLPTNGIRSLAALHDTLLIGTDLGIVYRAAGGFRSHPALGSSPASRMIPVGPQTAILISAPGAMAIRVLSHVKDNGTMLGGSSSASVTDIAIRTGGEPWISTPTAGIMTFRSGAWVSRVPNGPRSNLFTSLAVDASGILWVGTGINGGGQGFQRYDPALADTARWRVWTTASSPLIPTNDTYKVSPASDGSVWVSTWGSGVLQVKADSVLRRIDTHSKPSVASSVASSTTFAVIGGVASDDAGKPWFANRTAINGNVLARLENDSTFTYVRNGTGTGEGRFAQVLIDKNGTLWLGNSEATAKSATGLYYYNPTSTLPGTASTGGWGLLTQTDGLANNTIMSLCMGLDGDVWVGTDLGVTIFNVPSDPRIRRSSSFPLREQSIQTLAVDAVNNKWAGTKEGIFVVSPDGNQLLAQYNVGNTSGRLIDNDIRALAIDQRRGLVYVGTERGLSILAIAAVETQREFTALHVGPNPFRVPGADVLTIGGLVADATIKILNLDGTLVTQFAAQGGGRAFWDGRDTQGRLAPSGIYLVVAAATNGDQVGTGKVAVIRQ